MFVRLPQLERPCHRARGVPFWRLLDARTPALAHRSGIEGPESSLLATRSKSLELIGRYRVDRGKGHDQRVLGR